MHLDGTLTKIGNKSVWEVVVFAPAESEHAVESKIVKRGMLDSRDSYHQISDGEYVMLTSFTQSVQATTEE
jgi:hypothetical protein